MCENARPDDYRIMDWDGTVSTVVSLTETLRSLWCWWMSMLDIKVLPQPKHIICMFFAFEIDVSI